MKRVFIFLLFFQTIITSEFKINNLEHENKRVRLFSQNSDTASSPEFILQRQNGYRYSPSERSSGQSSPDSFLNYNFIDSSDEKINDKELKDSQETIKYLNLETHCLQEENQELKEQISGLRKRNLIFQETRHCCNRIAQFVGYGAIALLTAAYFEYYFNTDSESPDPHF